MLQQDFKTCQKCRGDLIPNNKISYDWIPTTNKMWNLVRIQWLGFSR